jgi:hypothetical protein
MSWPPPGVDPSLNDLLLQQDEATQAQRNAFLDLNSELCRLLEAKNRGDSDADSLLTQAEDLARRTAQFGDTTLAMLAGKLCGEILLDADRFREALARLQSVRDAYATVVRTGGAAERDNNAELLGLMGRCACALHDWERASAYFGEAIEAIEHDRYRISAPYLQSAYMKGRGAIYASGIGAAFKLADKETLLARAELSKARWVMRIHHDAPIPRDNTYLQQFWNICNQIRAIDPAGNQRFPSDREKALLNDLLDERRRLWDLLVIERFGESGNAPSFSIQAVQEVIGPETAILSYYWLDANALLVTAIDTRQVIVEPVILNDKERDCLKFVRNVIKSGWSVLDAKLDARFDRNIRGCSSLLPEKVRPAINDKRRLLISPHRQLHLFPFHALPWESGFLIEKFAVDYVPNLSTILAGVRPSPSARTLAAGAGTFPSSFALASLPAIPDELQDVAEASRNAGIPTQVLEGPGLTRRQLAIWNEDGTLESFSCIHLATHGSSVLAADTLNTPMESRLFLYDGALDGLEISWLKLNADLVVLSACNSGQRAISGRDMDQLPGDEIFGIQSAFAMAGARAVLGCLWPTNDQFARTIMADFHQRWVKCCSPEVALQHAIAGYLRQTDQRHCYRWAHFFLQNLRPRVQHNQERN